LPSSHSPSWRRSQPSPSSWTLRKTWCACGYETRGRNRKEWNILLAFREPMASPGMALSLSPLFSPCLLPLFFWFWAPETIPVNVNPEKARIEEGANEPVREPLARMWTGIPK
jgi:hypothetical protein